MSHVYTPVFALFALLALVGCSEGKAPEDFNNWEQGGCPIYGINECQYFEGSIELGDNVEYVQEFFVDNLVATVNFNVSGILKGDTDGLRLTNNPTNRLTIEHNANFTTTLHLQGTGATRTPLVLANDLTRLDATAAGEVTLTATTTKIPGTLHVHGSVTRGGTRTCSINNPHVGQLNGGIKFGPAGKITFKLDCLGNRGDVQMSHMVTSKISGNALDVLAAAPIDYKVNSAVKMTTSTTQAHLKTTDTVLGGTGGNKLFNGNGKLDINAPTSISLKVGTSTEAGKVNPDAYSVASGALQVGETTGALGACGVGNRGTLAAIYGGTGVGDIYYICMKNAADAYVWLPVSPSSAGPVGPKGNKGVKGTTGIKGIKGTKGVKGNQGAGGPQGPTGDKGNQGPQGEKQNKGLTGAAGPTGPKGAKGNTGAKGNAGVGATGDKGNVGLQQQCSGLANSVAVSPTAYFYHETTFNWVRTTISCTPDASWDHTDHRNFAVAQLQLRGPAESYWRCPTSYESLQRGRLCVSTNTYTSSYHGAMNQCAGLSGGHICTELELKTAGTAENIGWTGYSYRGPGNFCSNGMWLDSATATTAFATNSGDCMNNENVDAPPALKSGVRTFRCCI